MAPIRSRLIWILEDRRSASVWVPNRELLTWISEARDLAWANPHPPIVEPTNVLKVGGTCVRAERVLEAERARGPLFLQGNSRRPRASRSEAAVTDRTWEVQMCTVQISRKLSWKRLKTMPARCTASGMNTEKGSRISAKACSRVKRMTGVTVAMKDLQHVCTPAKAWKSCEAAHDSGWNVLCGINTSAAKTRLLTKSVACVKYLRKRRVLINSIWVAAARGRSQTGRRTLRCEREVFDVAGRE